MDTIIFTGQGKVEGIGFDKLGYCKIPIYKNEANESDTLTFLITPISGTTSRLIVEGAKFLTSSGQSESIDITAYSTVVIGNLSADRAYFYLPTDTINTLHLPYVNTGASINSLMASINLGDLPSTLTMLRANNASYLYSFLFEGDFNRLNSLSSFEQLEIVTNNWRTKEREFKVDSSVNLPKLKVLTLPTYGVKVDFDSAGVANSTLLASLTLSNCSKSKARTQHLIGKPFNYLYLLNSTGVNDNVVEGSLSDVSSVALNLKLDNAQFSQPYRSGTVWKDSITTVSLIRTNLSATECDALLADLNNSITTTKSRAIYIPARTSASDTIVASLQAKSVTIVV